MISIKSNKIFVSTFLIVVFLAVVFGVVLAHSVKNKIISDLHRIVFTVESSSDFEATLYYAYDEGFKNNQKLENLSPSENRLEFILPDSEKLITNYRLDFGNKRLSNQIKILEMSYDFKDSQKTIKGKKVFDTFFLNSASANLDFETHEIRIDKEAMVFDPYIVFNPIAQTLLDYNRLKIIVLLLPFLLFVILYCRSFFSFKDITVEEYFMFFFIICIPLKIAWSTLAALILVSLAIWRFYQKRKSGENARQGYFLIVIFLALVALGRPDDIQKIDHQLGLVLFGLVAMVLHWRREVIQKFYVFFFLILNGILVASGICFLLQFPDFFGLNLTEYFLEIKTYSGNIRNWLYYDHAAFLSFFGLIGLLFLHNISFFLKKELSIKILYHVFLLALIVLFGVRICLLIYVIFLINLLLKLKTQRRIIVNFSLFVIIAIALFFLIHKIDSNRAPLWSVSWDAIKEKPLFGHGLGSSDLVLHRFGLRDEEKTPIPLDLNHSHNQFFTFLVELGIFGSIVLFFLCTMFLVRTKQLSNITMVLFIFGLCYVFLTESILQTSKPLYVICFLFLLIPEKLGKPKVSIL